MRLFSAATAMLMLAATSAIAQGAPPPIYIKNTEINVLVTNGIGQDAQLALGYNILGVQHPLTCYNDEGCLVTVASMAHVNNVTGSWAICTLVDGEAATTPCPNQSPAPGKAGGLGNAIASVLLTKGQHTIETGVILNDIAGAGLGIWEVHYTKLVDPPHGHKK